MALTAEEITSEIAVLGEKIKQAKIEKKTQEFWGEFLQSMLALKVRFIVNESTRLVSNSQPNECNSHTCVPFIRKFVSIVLTEACACCKAVCVCRTL